jgi:hypothetical protein
MSKPTSIMPTIGRRLWYVPSTYDRGGMTSKPETIIEASSSQPCDAGVVFVHGERLVNLLVTDHNGNIHKRTSVTLYQPSDTITLTDGGYAMWMTYQQEQAQPKVQGSTTAKYFAFSHLPLHLQLVSKPLGQLAELLEQLLPNGPEKSAGMRKLLEAKDCFVRAALEAAPAELQANAPITDTERLQAWVYTMINGEKFDAQLSAELEKVNIAEASDEAELLPSFVAFLDTIVRHQRQPEQHTEGPDHAEA